MILFLDFDGVLHPHMRHEPDFCRLPQLWKILRACPDTRVVFSTSWREIYSPAAMIEFVASGEGKDLAHRVVGSTPSLEREGRYGRRDLEIQAWLDSNNHSGLWLALDDIPEIFCGQHPNLYVVDGSTGLTDADVATIIQRIRPRIRRCYTLAELLAASDYSQPQPAEERVWIDSPAVGDELI